LWNNNKNTTQIHSTPFPSSSSLWKWLQLLWEMLFQTAFWLIWMMKTSPKLFPFTLLPLARKSSSLVFPVPSLLLAGPHLPFSLSAFKSSYLDHKSLNKRKYFRGYPRFIYFTPKVSVFLRKFELLFCWFKRICNRGTQSTLLFELGIGGYVVRWGVGSPILEGVLLFPLLRGFWFIK